MVRAAGGGGGDGQAHRADTSGAGGKVQEEDEGEDPGGERKERAQPMAGEDRVGTAFGRIKPGEVTRGGGPNQGGGGGGAAEDVGGFGPGDGCGAGDGDSSKGRVGGVVRDPAQGGVGQAIQAVRQPVGGRHVGAVQGGVEEVVVHFAADADVGGQGPAAVP
ncbi:hypothetical protein CI102_15308 [Trichoderma harzianum]|nr:hypothetical protein CI102_15308 [Trichoderma harzianum]